jgi:hypothetical protein
MTIFYPAFNYYTQDSVECTEFATQRLQDRRINNGCFWATDCEHVLAVTNIHATIDLLLERVFSTLSVKMGYKEDNWGDAVI